MALTDRNKKRSSALDSSSFSVGGLAGRSSRRNKATEELDNRIANATTRLNEEGVDAPQPEEHTGIFQRLLNALDYLNNKKNQGLYMLTHGTNVWDTPEQVSGTDLLRDWTGGDFKGAGLAGFTFDALTDPLNLLSFGTAGAATQAAKAGGKAVGLAGRAARRGTGTATRLLKSGADEVAAAGGDSRTFIDRLMGPEGERLREIQARAEKLHERFKKEGLNMDYPEVESIVAKEMGHNLEDVYNSIYKENYLPEPKKAEALPGMQQPQKDLPIEATAPKPWKNGAYAREGKVEEVSVEWLSKLKGNSLRRPPERMDELVEDIRKNGFQEPLLVMIGQQDRKVILGEGNHRLEAARRLGYKYVPVRVMRQQKVINGQRLDGAVEDTRLADYFNTPDDLKDLQRSEFKPRITQDDITEGWNNNFREAWDKADKVELLKKLGYGEFEAKRLAKSSFDDLDYRVRGKVKNELIPDWKILQDKDMHLATNDEDMIFDVNTPEGAAAEKAKLHMQSIYNNSDKFTRVRLLMNMDPPAPKLTTEQATELSHKIFQQLTPQVKSYMTTTLYRDVWSAKKGVQDDKLHLVTGAPKASGPDGMSKVPVNDYFPGDAKPSDVFDEVPVMPKIDSADEIAAGAPPLLPPPADFQRVGPPGSTPPGTLAPDPKAPNRYFAQLGGHIPFTDIGGYWKVPGSEALLSLLGQGAGKAISGVGNVLSKIPGAPELGQAMKDVIGRNFKVGYGVPGEVNQIVQRTGELIRMDNKDIVDNLIEMRKGYEDLYGYMPGVDDEDIIRALEDPAEYEKLKPDLQKVADSVRSFFDVHYAKAEEAGVINDFIENYIPHVFKGKQAEVEAALEQMRRSGVRIKTSSPFARGRTMDATLSEIMADEKLREKLKPETNIVKLMAIYKSSLEKAIRNQDMLTELTALGPDIIRKETYTTVDQAGKEVTRQAYIEPGWVKAPVKQLKGYWVPPEIANYLKDAMEPFVNNVGFRKLLGFYDDMLGWWKGMATVPNLGFQIRNMMGNMFNNYLAGVRTLDTYMTARTVQAAEDTTMDYFYDVIKLFDDRPEWARGEAVSGLPSAERADQLRMFGPQPASSPDPKYVILDRIFNHNRFKARFLEGDGPRFRVNWEGKDYMVNTTGLKFFAKLYGVTGVGYYGADLGAEVIRKLDAPSTAQKWNPLSQQNPVFKHMERTGSFLEDNARLAHFIKKLESFNGNLDKASQSVKKYLFDYSNLTATEKNVMKRFLPFYAFTRNNLPLQLRELVKQPKYASMMATFQNWTDQMAEESTDTEMDRGDIPKFMSQLYSVRLPFQIGDEARDVMLGFDTPNRDINSIAPSEWFSMITPFLTVPFELVANRNTYTGRDLEAYKGETVRAPGYLQGIFKVVNTLGPDDPQANIFNQFFQWAPGTTVATDDDGNPELRITPYVGQILNQIVFAKNIGKAVDFATGDSYDPFGVSSMLTGVSGSSSTLDQRETNSKYQHLQALEDLLRKMKDEGSPVPTLKEIEQNQPGYKLRKLLGGR